MTKDYVKARDTLLLAREAISKAQLEGEDRKRAMLSISDLRARINKEYEAAKQTRKTALKETVEKMEEERLLEERSRRIRSRIANAANNTMLPEDVIVTIGTFALKSNPNIPVVMGGVCRFWRRAVCSNPILWSTLYLGSKKPKAKAALWRERSNGRLASLGITQAFDCDKNSSLLCDLRKIARHVRELNIINAENLTDYGWEDAFTHLETLSVKQIGAYHKSTVEYALDLGYCGTSSTLRHIDYENVTLSFVEQADGWDIRSARLVGGNFNISLLRRMPDLESLEIVEGSGVDRGEDIDPDLGEDITMSTMKRFTSDHHSFPSATMPNLIHLDLYSCRRSTLSNFFPSCMSSQLTFFDVGGVIFEEEQLVILLQRLPQLRFLGVSKSTVTDKTLDRLAIRENSVAEERICPYLSALSLAETNITASALRDMVNSRLPKDQRIMVQRAVLSTSSKTASAFRPMSSSQRARSQPAASRAQQNESSSTADKPENATEVQSQLSSSSTMTPSRIDWLCVDNCEQVDPSVIPILQKKITFVSAVIGKRNEDRIRGQAKYRWDAAHLANQNSHASCGLKKDGKLVIGAVLKRR